ncbi:MAG: class I SAM-dependent methyltransferase [Planctomycetota bacterium]|jgi:SAM-dependent methyltransferase
MPDDSSIDFGRRSGDYARYRPGFPDSFYDRLERLMPLDGVAALDLGTGPGVVALALARRGALVTGIDVSANQIDAAVRAAAESGLGDRAGFLVRRAEETGLPDGAFDLVTAGQCWVWFDQDAVLREVTRLLRPHGLLVVAHYCYLAHRSRVAQETERLVLRFNPTWTMAGATGVYPNQIDQLTQGGLELVEQFCYDHARPFTHEAWRGRVRTCNGVGSGVMTDEQVAAFDAELAEMLRARFPQEPLMIWHRVWAVVGRRPRAAAS